MSSGVVLEARLERAIKSPLVEGVKEECEGFVDDSEVLCSCDADFIAVDNCVATFERVSGALLNRSSKSVVLGLGKWKDRELWPLPWLKSVKETKIFGFILR